MKKIIVLLLLSAVIVISCSKNEKGGNGQTFNMELGAEMPDYSNPGAKTYQTSKFITHWLEGDQLFYSEQGVKVSEKSDANKSTNVRGKDSRGVFPIMATAGHSYYAVYPYSSVNSVDATGTASITIPTEQNNTSTFDSYCGSIANNAEILFASQNDPSGGFTIAGEEPYIVNFKRATSVLCLRLIDHEYKIPEFEKILSATIKVGSAKIAGTATKYLSSGEISGFNASSITLKYDSNDSNFPNFTGIPSDADAYSRCSDLFAVVAPVVIAQDELIEVIVHTDNFDLTFDNNSHSAIPLQANKVTTLNLRITNVALNTAAQSTRYYFDFPSGYGVSDADGTYGGTAPDHNLTTPLCSYGEQQYATMETMVKFDPGAFTTIRYNQIMGFAEKFFIRLINETDGWKYQGVVFEKDNKVNSDVKGPAMTAASMQKWHHVALTFAGGESAGTISLIVDGTVAESKTVNGLTRISFNNLPSTDKPYSSFTLAATAVEQNSWSNRYLIGSLAQPRIWAGTKAETGNASNACRSWQDLKRNRLLIPTTRVEYSHYKEAAGLCGLWLYVDTNPGANAISGGPGLQRDWGTGSPALEVCTYGGTIAGYSL